MSYSFKEVFEKFPEEIKNKYNFSNAVYINALVPITGIVCAVHGEFKQYSAQLRKNKAGCPSCGEEKRINSRRTSPQNYIDSVTELHNNKYNYSETNYINMVTQITVICPAHGSFLISPIKHLHGKQGCPVCGAALRGKRKDVQSTNRKTADNKLIKHSKSFKEQAKAVHGDVYDYSDVAYKGARKQVEIICKKHGVFSQTPGHHLGRTQGCPRCGNTESKQEKVVAKHAAIFTPVICRDRTTIKPKELDILMPEVKLAIEYCGMYWHSHKDIESENRDKHKHFQKYLDCQKQGIRLLTVYESEWQERPAAIKRLIRNAIGKSKGRLMARKCELKRVSNAEARAFYEKYHPQGGAGSGEHYGLYWKDKLVACMRFSLGANDRGSSAKSRVWTLGRYATRVNVAGAASRLFKAFLAEFDPSEVKSFSDNRYFSGGMYEQLGFTLELEVPPDYQVWSPKLGLLPKPHYQRRVLAKRQKDHGVAVDFTEDDKRTEREVTYAMGARRIYDCGKKRWVWKK